MRKFVKYGNRKLHEEGSEDSYISIFELGVLVAAGADVVVVDDRTGEDLTTMTLARALYDRCRAGYAVPIEAVAKLLVESKKTKVAKVA